MKPSDLMKPSDFLKSDRTGRKPLLGTPEVAPRPWQLSKVGLCVCDANGFFLVHGANADRVNSDGKVVDMDDANHANLKHIVKCVNAEAGICEYSSGSKTPISERLNLPLSVRRSEGSSDTWRIVDAHGNVIACADTRWVDPIIDACNLHFHGEAK